MIYTYTITCVFSTDMLFFSYTNVAGNTEQFNLSGGQSFSYSGEYAPFLIAPFPTNLFNYTTTIS
jgi:hypothetical protein